MRCHWLWFWLFSLTASAQEVPPAYRTAWAGAGYPGCLPEPARSVEATQYGFGHSGTDEAPALLRALAALEGQPGLVLLPAGTFRVGQTIALPAGAVLRGAGAGRTRLVFDLGGQPNQHAFIIAAPQSAAFTALTAGYQRGSQTVTLAAEEPALRAGDYAEIRQANGAWDARPADWATYAVGQIVRVTSVRGTQVTVEKQLRIDYEAGLQPELRRITPITDVGIEQLTITRADVPSTGGGHQVFMQYAARCWLRAVESHRSVGSHVLLDASTQVEITGCHLHEAAGYDGASTRGYGITLIQHTGECRVENNVLHTLRHALMVKQGANGNVLAYNYSTDARRTEPPTDAGSDLSLHGHYPFANLFEGNIAQTLFIDQVWGPAGPGNTFLRNRLERYGILISAGPVPTDDQVFIANDVTDDRPDGGLFLLTGQHHVTVANRVKGTLQPGGPAPLPNSYAYRYPNDFWGAAPWPGTGPEVKGDPGNPARDRYRTNGPRTFWQTARPPQVAQQATPEGIVLTTHPAAAYQWEDGSTAVPRRVPGPGTYRLTVTSERGCVTATTVEVGTEPAAAQLFPNPSAGERVRLRNLTPTYVQVLTLSGQAVPVHWERDGIDWLLTPLRPLVPGLYLVRVEAVTGTRTLRWMVR